MNRHHDPNPFDEEEEIINPFSKGGGRVPAASRPAGFGQSLDATVDIPLDNMNDSSQKQRKLADWEAELRKKEMDIKRREDAIASSGVQIDDKNWPPFLPIIHHDIANEIPVHAQKLQYLAFASWLGLVLCLVFNVIATMVCWIKGGDFTQINPNKPKKNHKLPMLSATTNSGDENMDQAHGLYSSMVHNAIIVINGGAYALLQYVTTQSWAPTKAVADGPKTIVAFLVLSLIYVILRVCEVKLQNRSRIRNFVGHTSHLSGALAAIMLISLISPIFTIIAGALWFVWVFVVMYITFAECKSSEENESEARRPFPV